MHSSTYLMETGITRIAVHF